jgi:hypothetical protein
MPTEGQLWVEGTKIAYRDASQVKRAQEGALEGATGKIPGHIWIESTKFRYIDSSGNERCIEGTSAGFAGKVLPLTNPRGYWGSGWDLSYTTIHDLGSATWYHSYSGMPNVYVSQYHKSDSDMFLIYRALIGVDLTSLSPPIDISEAKLVCPFGWIKSTLRDIYIVLVDATGVTANGAGYGIMHDKTTSLGSLLVPAGYNPGYGLVEIPLNSAGIEFLENNAGEVVQVGIRIDQDISTTPPSDTISEAQDFFTPVVSDTHPEAYMWVIYPGLAGHIWVEGTKFAYVDSGYFRRTFEGT